MPEIPAEGQPFQSAPELADAFYTTTPPSFGNDFGARMGLLSILEPLTRFMTQEAPYLNTLAGKIGRGLLSSGDIEGGIPADTATFGPALAPLPSETLSPEEANKQYAPQGVRLFDQPVARPVAEAIGKARSAEIERQGIIARSQRSGLTQFGMDMAAFMMDPLNAATMFIPGVGEGTFAAALGRGALARTAARLGAGATAGAAAQAPLSALRYGISEEEQGDYDLKTAARDLFYGAVGGGIFHAGIGAVGDLFAHEAPAPRAPAPEEDGVSGSAASAPLGANRAAMATSLAQMLEGRQINVAPVFDAARLRSLGERASLQGQADALSGQLDALAPTPAEAQASETLARLQAVERNLTDQNLTAGERRALMDRRDELLADTTPEKLRAQVAPAGQRRLIQGQIRETQNQIADIDRQYTQGALDRIQAGPLDERLRQLPEMQAQVYRDGFAQGVPQDDLEKTAAEVFGPKPEQEKSEVPKAPEQEKATATDIGAAPEKPTLKLTPDEETAAQLEADFARITQGRPIAPEDAETLNAAKAELDAAQQNHQGYNQAAACLDGSGV